MTDALSRVMVDIETLGLDPGAAILSIAAVQFGPGRLGETFERTISVESCQDAGLTVDGNTLDWWLQQDSDARHVLTGGEDLEDALAEFSSWYDDRAFDEIWANSPAFDCIHLEHAFESVGLEAPWEFYEQRDYRTLTGLPVAPSDPDHDGVEHDALDDAKHQARVAATTLQRVDQLASDASVSGGDA
jgi:DNA polymerase III epsilon subunit-like protein